MKLRQYRSPWDQAIVPTSSSQCVCEIHSFRLTLGCFSLSLSLCVCDWRCRWDRLEEYLISLSLFSRSSQLNELNEVNCHHFRSLKHYIPNASQKTCQIRMAASQIAACWKCAQMILPTMQKEEFVMVHFLHFCTRFGKQPRSRLNQSCVWQNFRSSCKKNWWVQFWTTERTKLV